MLTRQGWFSLVVALGLIVAGRVLGTLELFLLGTVLAALVAVAAGYVAMRRVHVDVGRELHPPRVHAGSPSRVELRVHNRGRWTSPVMGLRDAVAGTRGAHLLVGPLAPDHTARAAYRLPTERRGILEIGPLRAELGDPFGMARMKMRVSGVSELTVYPHIDEITPVPQTTGNDPLAGADHPNALGRTGEDFYALRPYVVGDDLRRVHWPSTARLDDLMVRQDELPWQGRATVIADLRASTTSPELLELVVSAAASIIHAGARRQDLLRLITTDGVDSGFAAGHGHIEAIMEHLASVDASVDDGGWGRVIDRVARASSGGALVVVTTGRLPAPERDQLRRLRSRAGSVTVVAFDESAGDPTAPEVTDPRDGWLWVTARHRFAEVWNAAWRPGVGQRRSTGALRRSPTATRATAPTGGTPR